MKHKRDEKSAKATVAIEKGMDGLELDVGGGSLSKGGGRLSRHGNFSKAPMHAATLVGRRRERSGHCRGGCHRSSSGCVGTRRVAFTAAAFGHEGGVHFAQKSV